MIIPVAFEALFILVLDEDEGYIVESVVEDLEIALAGAVLVELALQERIELKDDQVPILSLKYCIKSHLREIVLAGGQPELADQVLLSF